MQISGGGTIQFVPRKSDKGQWTSGRIESKKAFMADADKAVAEKSYENAASATVRRKGMKAAKSAVEYKTADFDDDAVMKDTPKKKPSVYKTYQSKE